jgi:hypothetical protein
MVTSFNPKFSFGTRRVSQDVTATREAQEREPLLAAIPEAESSNNHHQLTGDDYSFLNAESQKKLPIYATIHRYVMVHTV